jgi:preprotein translocase subunit SecD
VYRRTSKPPEVADSYVVKKQTLADGENVADAVVALDAHDGPTVVFRLDSAATYRFAQAARGHVGEPLAILSGGTLLEAPTIAETLSGPVQISGNFSLQEAEDLATILRNGKVLPRLTVVEQQTVDPAARTPH